METIAPLCGSASPYVLDIKDLKTYFYLPDGVVKAVDSVSFNVKDREIIGLVGESGCGKSATALSILRLIPSPPGKVVSGEIKFQGQDLRTMPLNALRDIRGNRISMIFQEPMTSLNPVYSIGAQIAEVYIAHQAFSKSVAQEKAKQMLEKVQVPSKRFDEYPHQLSGGMRQRVMIAMALCCNPELILADEPTTALDVTIQAQILDLMMELQESLRTAIIMITHNLGIVARFAKRVIVMYSGKIIEQGPVIPIFQEPLHPYTMGLLKSIPKLGQKAAMGKKRLTEIPGAVPRLSDKVKGCNFHPRCSLAREVCRKTEPDLFQIEPGRKVACWARIEGWA